MSFCCLYAAVGDVHCCGVGASSGGASCDVVYLRPGLCTNMFMQLKIYVYVTESKKNSSSHSVASESLARVSQNRNLMSVCTHLQ